MMSKPDKIIRQRKQLVFTRKCFVLLFCVAFLFCCLWGIAHLNGFWLVLVWIVLGLWSWSLVQVVFCKFFNPVVTPLMVHRCFQWLRNPQRRVRFSRFLVPIEDISPNLIGMADIGENGGLFYHCRGFMFDSLYYAYNHNKKSSTLCGGSTISQQTAKNCFLPHSRTLLRKVVEAYYVLLIELLWGKKRIMECYLNIIEFGDGIYGCEAASRHYFGHSANRLTDMEASLLIATLPWPRTANPHKRNPRYDHLASVIKQKYQDYTPIAWNARWEDLDIQKVEMCNRGLLFFVKWVMLNRIKELTRKTNVEKT